MKKNSNARKPQAAGNPTTADFYKLAADYYDETFERFPTYGGAVGIKKYQPLLGSATPRVHEDQGKLTRETLTRLIALPVHRFEGNAWLDRLTLRAHLIRENLSLNERKTWQTNPQSHLDGVADAIYSLIVRHADDLRPVAPAIVSRLRAIPKHLKEAEACIRKPVPLWTKLTMQSAAGVAGLMMSLPDQLQKVTRHSRAELDRWAKAAADAAAAYAKSLEKKSPGPANGFSLGTERFEMLVRERLGLNLTAAEAESAALGLIENLKRELAAEAKKFHPRKSANEILEEAAHQWKPDGKDLLEAYKKTSDLMRERFIRAGAMTFPKGDRLLVKPVPDFMAHQFPTAAYSSPGALDPDQTGIFWVNDLSKRRTNEKDKRAEIEQHFGLELTSAHEAYPGHHLQFVMQHKHPSLVRKLADHSIYYEGWTLWCEQMCVDLKAVDNPYVKLQQLHDALWRANRIVIDCGLHTGKLNYRSACAVLEKNVGFTRARAQGDVNWYTSSPTIPMSYLLGKMELMRLKRQRVDHGGWTLKQFNDWVLGFGAIPWSWIEASGE